MYIKLHIVIVQGSENHLIISVLVVLWNLDILQFIDGGGATLIRFYFEMMWLVCDMCVCISRAAAYIWD